jgi:hypothetical protein
MRNIFRAFDKSEACFGDSKTEPENEIPQYYLRFRQQSLRIRSTRPAKTKKVGRPSYGPHTAKERFGNAIDAR